jgi:hypothetical protein
MLLMAYPHDVNVGGGGIDFQELELVLGLFDQNNPVTVYPVPEPGQVTPEELQEAMTPSATDPFDAASLRKFPPLNWGDTAVQVMPVVFRVPW